MKKYLKIAHISFLNYLEYRFDILSNLLMNLLGIGTSYFIWHKLASDYSQIGSYNQNEIISYYLISCLFIGFINPRTAKRYERLIKDGGLSNLLIKPLNEKLSIFFKEIGGQSFIILLSILVFSIPIYLIPGIRNELNINPSSIFFTLIFMVLSNLFLYLMYSAIGVFSFWTDSGGGLRNIIINLIIILRGSWFPLDLAPTSVQKILSLIPFQYAMYYPVKILTGETNVSLHIRGIVVLILSILAFGLLTNFLWKKGIKKYEAYGN